MEVEITSKNVKVAIEKFFALEGVTYNEKKKSFRAFLKNLSLSAQELDEFGNHLCSNKPCEFSVDVLLHFKMHQHVLEVIKSGNGPLVGRILKDWTFLKHIFTCVTPEELVNTVLPLLSFTMRMKIIARITKTLTDELIADRLFALLEDLYGIITASVLIPVCSITLIKSKIVYYDLILSERHLWIIYKKDPTFVEYYFAHLDVSKVEISVVHNYKQLLKRILNTNLVLFWKLVEKYKIPIKIGKHSSKKLLTNREVIVKYAAELNSSVTFAKRQTYHAAVKLGIQKEYLLTFYPDNSDDFLTRKLNIVPSLQKFVPQKQRFTITNTLFREKYSDDLFNYPTFFRHKHLLERITVSEREALLDKMEDNDEFLYFYSTIRSVPMLKEKLLSASDIHIRTKLIMLLFKTCNLNNDQTELLNWLNLLYNRYRNDTPTLTQFMNTELTTWKQFNVLKSEHWDAINKILNYVRLNNDMLWYTAKYTYFREYFKFLIDNNESTDELLQTFVNESLEKDRLQGHDFGSAAKYEKIFYERTEKLFKLQNDHKNYKSVSFNFLQDIIGFDRKNPDLLNLKDYMYMLDFFTDTQKWYDSALIHILNKFGIFHENIQKYCYGLKPGHFSIGFYKYCINKSPKELLKTNLVFANISVLNVDIFELLKCPYLEQSFSSFKRSALYELNTTNRVLNRHFSIKFLCVYDENEFYNFSKQFDPPEDGKIPPNFDAIRLDVQKSIIKVLPLVSFPQNTTILIKYCKGDYLKFALPSLYKILFRTPNIQVEDFLGNMYKSAVSVRKHSLCLGRHLLTPKLFGNFLETVNNQENNLSLRFVFLKKALEYFIETHDEKFYHFFLESLDKVDDNDHSVFDYIMNYSKIPRSYLLDYIKQICQKISVNSDQAIRIKRFTVLNTLPDYVFENLDVSFITWCFEEHFFEIMPFAIKCLFNSKSDNHHQLIFDKFKTSLSGDIRCPNSRANVTGFVQQFCEQSLKRKTVDKFTIFYSNCQHAFPRHRLINDIFLMNFTQKWFESREDVKVFALKINEYLIDTVKLYPHGIISVYCDQLRNFMSKANIDKFEFLDNFFYTNSLDETYVAVIYLLPNKLPSLKNVHHMYIPLLEALDKINTLVVVAHLDLYYGRTR